MITAGLKNYYVPMVDKETGEKWRLKRSKGAFEVTRGPLRREISFVLTAKGEVSTVSKFYFHGDKTHENKLKLTEAFKEILRIAGPERAEQLLMDAYSASGVIEFKKTKPEPVAETKPAQKTITETILGALPERVKPLAWNRVMQATLEMNDDDCTEFRFFGYTWEVFKINGQIEINIIT